MVKQPAFTLSGTGTVDFGKSNLAIGQTTLTGAGTMMVSESMTVANLQVNAGTISIQPGKTLTSSGSVTFTNTISLSIGTGGVLDATNKAVTFDGDYDLTVGTIKGDLSVEAGKTLSVSGGTLEGDLLVKASSSFNFNSGSIDGVALSTNGDTTIASNVNSLGQTLTINQGTFSIDSSSNPVDVAYKSFQISVDLTLPCTNDITFSTDGTTQSQFSGVDISGAADCTVSLPVDDNVGVIILGAPTLQLKGITSESKISTTTVTGGTIETDGNTLVVLDVLTLNAGAKIVDAAGATTPVKISHTEVTSEIKIQSEQSFLFDYITATPPRGKMVIDNTATNVQFSGSGNIKTGNAWTLTNCASVGFNQPFIVTDSVNINCPTDFNNAVTITSGSIGVGDTTINIAAGQTFDGTGGTFTLSNSILNSRGTVTIGTVSSSSSTVNILAGTFVLTDDANTAISDSDIIINGGSMNVTTINTLLLQSNSVLIYQTGTLVTNTATTLEFNSAEFQVKNALTYVGNIDLVASKLNVSATSTFQSGQLTSDGISTIVLDTDVTFASGYSAIIGDTAVTQNALFNMNGEIQVLDGTTYWSNSDLNINGNLTNDASSIVVNTTSTVTIGSNSEIVVTNGGTFIIESDSFCDISGSIYLDGTTSRFRCEGDTILRDNPTIEVSSGICLIRTPTFINSADANYTITGGMLRFAANGDPRIGKFQLEGGKLSFNGDDIGVSGGDSADVTLDGTGIIEIRSTVNQENMNLIVVGGLSTIELITGSTFNWNQGDLILNSNLELVADGGEFILNGGNVIVQSGGVISMDTSSAFRDLSGTLQTSGDAEITIVNSIFETTRPLLSFGDTTKVSLGGSTLTYSGLIFSDDSQLILDQGTTVFDNPLIIESELLISTTGTIVTINDEFGVSGRLESSNGALINFNSGCDVGFGSTINFLSNTIVNLNGGTVTVFGPGSVDFEDATLKVGDGDMIVEEGAFLEFTTDAEASFINDNTTDTGRVRLQTGSTLVVPTTMDPYDPSGVFVFEGTVNVQYSSSTSSNYGANVTEAGPDCILYEDGDSQTYDNSNVTLYDRACWRFENSILSLEDSLFNLHDHSRLFFNDRSLFSIRGDSDFDMRTNSTLSLSNFSLGNLYAPTFVNPTITPPNYYHIDVDDSSGLQIFDTTIFAGQAKGRINSNSTLLVRGTFELRSGTSLEMYDSFLILDKLDINFCFNFFFGQFCFSIVTTTKLDLEGEWTAERSIMSIADLMEISGGGFAEFTNCTVRSNHKGRVIIRNSGSFTAQENSDIEIGDLVDIGGIGDLTLIDNTRFSMNTSATIVVQEDGKIQVEDTSHIFVDGPLIMNGTGRVHIDNNSDFNLLGTGDLDMRDDSRILIENSNSFFRLNNGIINLYDDAKLFAINTGNLLLETGQLYFYSQSKLFTSNGFLNVYDNCELEAYTESSIELDASSVATLNGTAIFFDDSEFLISNSSIFSIYGNLTVYNNGLIDLSNQAEFNILSSGIDFGSLLLKDMSSMNNNDSFCSIQGSAILEDQATITSSFGSFLIESQQLLLKNDSSLSLTQTTDLIIDGGQLNAGDDSIISVLSSSLIEINDNDMNIFGFADFEIKTKGTVRIQGITANARLFGNSETTISNLDSKFEVTSGNSYCSENATITLSNNGKYNVTTITGSSIFEDNCDVIGSTQAGFFTSGNTLFSDQSNIKLNFANFTVVGGDCSFTDTSIGNLTSTSFFKILNGNANFEDDSNIYISFSTFTVENGGAFQRNNSAISITKTGTMNIDSSFQQFDSSLIYIEQSTFTVGGTFHSNNDAMVQGVNSFLDLGSDSNVNLYDDSNWNVFDNILSITGNFNLFNNASLLSNNNDANFIGTVSLFDYSIITGNNSTTYTVQNGNFIASNNSLVNILDNSFLSVTSGNVLFQHDSVLYIDGTSEFFVSNGDVVFQDFTNFQTEPNTVININAGSLTFKGSRCLLFLLVDITIRGDLSMELDSCVTYQDSSISINNGNLQAIDNFSTNFDQSSIDISNGNAIFNGTILSSASFVNLPFNVLSGNVNFYGNTPSTFDSIILTITNGGVLFSDDTISTWLSSTIIIEELEDGPFVTFDTNAVVTLTDTNILISSGHFDLLDFSQSTWMNCTISLEGADLSFLGEGNHLFYDSLITVTRTDANADFEDVFVGFYNTDFRIETEGSIVSFYGNVTAENENMNFTITNGDVYLSEYADISFLDSTYSIADGSLFSNNDVQISFENTPFNILASSSGKLQVSDFSNFTYTNSPIIMNGGDVLFEDNSTLLFTDIGTTLDINFGNFIFNDYADFFTVPGTKINITNGSFKVLGYVDIYFDQVQTYISASNGVLLLKDFSTLESSQSLFNIIGSLNVTDSSNFIIDNSNIEITSGILTTYHSSSFSSIDSIINVYGNVEFYGTIQSNHYFENTITSIYNGADFLLFQQVESLFAQDSIIILEGGFFRAFDNSHIIINDSTMNLQGDGTLLVFDDAAITIENQGFVGVETSGATATFSDTSSLDVYALSTMNISDGSVSFRDQSTFNLWPESVFNLIDGSLFLLHQTTFVAYPYTQGIITDGNFHVRDQACVTFLQSSIDIQGSIDNNSTCTVNVLQGSNLNVTGGNLVITGYGEIISRDGSFIHVSNGSISLYDFARLVSDNASVLVSGGSILAFDSSTIVADNQTDVVVTGGNITMSDLSRLFVGNQSLVLVSSGTNTQGAVYATGSSFIDVTEQSTLEVNGGNLIVNEYATTTLNENSIIRVINGNLEFQDYSTFIANNGFVRVLINGNILASGVQSSMTFIDTSTLVEGNLIVSTRNSLLSQNSTFDVTNAGNFISTDITRSILEDRSILNIYGGGDFELSRSADFILRDSSEINVSTGGSAIFGEDVYFDLLNSSSLRVDGGDILFYSDSYLNAQFNSIGEVTSGGSIYFDDNSIARLSDFSRLTVFDDGNIFFSNHSQAMLTNDAVLFVQDGGSIVFEDNSILSSDHSFLTVFGGGSIILSGEGINNIDNQSEFIVDGGNIEYYDNKIIEFNNSFFEISSGNFITHDHILFNMMNQSIGKVTGGDLILYDSSIINMNDLSDITISSGNVEMYNQGNINMEYSSISVSGEINSLESGNFFLNNNVLLNMNHSQIFIDGGDFDSNDHVETNALYSIIQVNSGSASFNDNSYFNGITSQMIITGGNLNLEDSTNWILSDHSIASVSGGNLNLNDNSITYLIDSEFNVSGGNINLFSSSNLTISSSKLNVTGGDLIHDNQSTFYSFLSIISISNGRIIYDGFSICEIQNTIVNVEKEIVNNNQFLQSRIPSPITDDDLIIFGGDSFVHVFDQSILSILQGNFVLVERARGLFEDISILIDGGQFNLLGSSQSEYSTVSISILDGNLLASDNSFITINENSNIQIQGGSFTMDENSSFESNLSNIFISSGSVLFQGFSNSNFINSQISIENEGSFNILENSNVISTSSSFILNGSGDESEFVIDDFSSVYFNDQSNVFIQNGIFRTGGNSEIYFDNQSLFDISGGDSYFEDSSIVTIDNYSTMQVQDGNVYFLDNSIIQIQGNSIYSILGGNIFTEGSTNIQLKNSCFTLEDGNINYSDSSIIELYSSCWNITGGNAYFEDATSYSLFDNSLLFIEKGSFIANGNNIQLQIDQSKTFIQGGDLIIQGKSNIDISSQSIINVESGNAIFSGDIEASVRDSSFFVSGGFVTFNGTSTLDWVNSLLSVSSGDMIIEGSSTASFYTSNVKISGGSLRFLGEGIITFLDSTIDVSIGSLNFLEHCLVDIIDSSVSINHGNMQFTGESGVYFAGSSIYISGQLEFLDRSIVTFNDSNIEIVGGGSLHAKDFSDIKFLYTSINIAGSLHFQNDADILIDNSRISIENGDLRVFDRGSLSVHRSSVQVKNGDFIIQNSSPEERKYVSIQNSVFTVEAASSSSILNGNVELKENVELTMIASDFIIDGSLLLDGNSILNIYDESSFIIPTGTVKMDVNSKVLIDNKSSLLNKGQLVAPGELNAPSDSSLSNEGIFESQHDLSVNCNANTAGTPLYNSGSFSLSSSSSSSSSIQSCIDDLRHSGLMQFSNSNVTFNNIETSSSSVFTLSSSYIEVTNNNNVFASQGSVGGSGSFGGSLDNSESGIIMANGESGTSRIHVNGQFSSAGTMFFSINSRDLNDPNSITQINAGDVDLSGGRACVCFNPNLVLEEGDRFDLLSAITALQGTFNTVEFDCIECPRRNAKSSEASNSECEPTADYGSRSFAVLFASCGSGDGNYFDSISPPWYVIFPVALGIIVLVVIIFGGGLVLEGKYRDRRITKKLAKKNELRKQKFKDSLVGSNTS